MIEKIKQISPETIVVGFKAEYKVSPDELRRRAEALLDYADVVYASDVSKPVASFGSPTTEGIIVSRRGTVEKIGGIKKEEVARRLLQIVHEILT